MTKKEQAHRFGELLKSHRKRMGMTLVELGAACAMDHGHLSRVERGDRRPPKLPRLLKLLEKLGIQEESPEGHELLSAAAQDRFESLGYRGITYLGHENPLHGLPPEQSPPRDFTVTEAACEIGKISASRRVKRIIVETSDGSEWFFPIRDEEGDPSQG